MNTVLTPASKDGLLWWQIHGCMVELYKTQPNARNIALGEIHYVLRTPERSVFVYAVTKPTLISLVLPMLSHQMSFVVKRYEENPRT